MPQAAPAGCKYVAPGAWQSACAEDGVAFQAFQPELLQLMANAQQAGQVDDCLNQVQGGKAAQPPARQVSPFQILSTHLISACMGHTRQDAPVWKFKGGGTKQSIVIDGLGEVVWVQLEAPAEEFDRGVKVVVAKTHVKRVPRCGDITTIHKLGVKQVLACPSKTRLQVQGTSSAPMGGCLRLLDNPSLSCGAYLVIIGKSPYDFKEDGLRQLRQQTPVRALSA